jgi:hypothetical protein
MYQTTKIQVVVLGIVPKVWWVFFLHFITTFGSFTTVGQFRTFHSFIWTMGFLCDSANGLTWEMFLLKKTHRGV